MIASEHTASPCKVSQASNKSQKKADLSICFLLCYPNNIEPYHITYVTVKRPLERILSLI